MITFEDVHKRMLDQRAELICYRDKTDIDSFYYLDAQGDLERLNTCLEEMEWNWDGKEHTLVETSPGYDPPWMYEDDLEDKEMIVCDICGYAVAEDEFFECPTCEVHMCLYCYEGNSCPDHAGEE